MAKKLLIIDNDDLTDTIREIYSIAKREGIAIECYPLYIGLPNGGDVIDPETKRINIKLVKEKFEKEYGTLRFHLIAFDFNLNDGDTDGVELIRQFNALPKTRNIKKTLFSFELNEIVQGYLDEYKEKQNYDRAWNSFRTLITLNILDFTKREEVEKKLVSLISKIHEKDDDFILEELSGNKDLKFNPSIEIFEGMTFDEIAERININDSLSPNFKRKIIQMAISHFSYLKNE